MRTRRSVSALVVPAAFVVATAVTSPAAGAITISDTDTIRSDATGEVITVRCVDGFLNASGVVGHPCAGITTIRVFPRGGVDTVDLAGVTSSAFPALASTYVDAMEEEPDPLAADIVNGSPGFDVLRGDRKDVLNGVEGDDLLIGGASVSGGGGDDTIVEYLGTGTPTGGAGDDRFIGFVNGSGVEGGNGFDSYELDLDSFSSAAGQLTMQLGADLLRFSGGGIGPDVNFSVGGIELVEMVLLRSGAQTWDGSAFGGIQRVRGLAGVDIITGGVHDDDLQGGDDDDTITGGLGMDLLYGGDGNDTIQARDGVADRVDCGLGTDSVVADALDVVVNCEVVDQPAPTPPPAPPAPPAEIVFVPVVPVTNAVTGPAKVKKGKAGSFTFSSPTAGATFQCQLDNGAWKACASAYKVKTKKLKLGKHTLLVRALLSGAADATPSKKTFKVVKG